MDRNNLPNFVRIADALRAESDKLIKDMENYINKLRTMLAKKRPLNHQKED